MLPITIDFIPKSSIHISQHGSIDSQLKALKLLSRRLQSVLSTHATELQILQRIYYKNKNQHTGALFWRNVVELRRYSDRLETLNLHSSTLALRQAFYGSRERSHPTTGSWTHCPDINLLDNYSKLCRTGMKLTEKMSARCLNAYKSFHRSLQSAAFLQLLLMFVAISSRLGALSKEVGEILRQLDASVGPLLSVISTSRQAGNAQFEIQSHDVMSPKPISQHVASMPSPPHAIIEIIGAHKLQKNSLLVRKSSEKKPTVTDENPLLKQKKKVKKDEIDDVFGF
ncbi:hypothetical protein M413DRAFT_21431 [Hebeloma cylindrosporum]|uniref:Nucleolus and neural progenitor protein-like N-terminal domain-containing protein n=1 Tax=Hebeloma cylindrosporum TaxID=76867 RepID=A0A0C3CKE4_HEBCY|nr:hypothetical protein M413DRAFT_21431 [Hebeloma cylindrosporum h7]